MDCKYIKKLISKYFDKQTDSAENNLLFEHINSCSNCKKDFDLFSKIYSKFPKKQNVPLSPYFNQKLKTYISNNKNQFFINQILKPVGVFFSLAIFFFVLSVFLIKPKVGNIFQNDFVQQTIDDEDDVIFDLIELSQEINNETIF